MSRWVEKRLGDCVSFLSGGTPARDNPSFWEGEVPWASNKDMKVGRLHDTIEHISSDAAESSSKVVPANSLLLVVRGMALAKMLPIAITQRPMAFNQDLKALKPKGGISGAFLYYWFVANTDYVLSKADEAAHGTKRLQTPTLEELRVRLPFDISEQHRIVSQLGQIDDWIENCKQRIELLEDAARLIYTEWFVRLRFPGHEKTNANGSLPHGWHQEALGQRIELNYGKSLKESDRQPGEIPVFGSSGIVGSHASALSQGPGIVVGRKGNVGSIFYSPVPFFAIDTVYFISPEQTTFFLLHTLQRMNFISSDAAVPGLNRNYAYSQPVIWPSDSVLSEFEATCTPIYEQITTLEKQSAALKSARNLLLPRLISGQLRL